jgi:hypothetical protein
MASELIIPGTEFNEQKIPCLRSLFITDPSENRNNLKLREGSRVVNTWSWVFQVEETRHWLGLNGLGTRDDQISCGSMGAMSDKDDVIYHIC